MGHRPAFTLFSGLFGGLTRLFRAGACLLLRFAGRLAGLDLGGIQQSFYRAHENRNTGTGL
eukprot:COSAG05_NODE_88_length_20344_cov_12.094690_1_plen_61_part_00